MNICLSRNHTHIVFHQYTVFIAANYNFGLQKPGNKYTKIYYFTFCLGRISYDKINDARYKFHVRDENTTSKTLNRIKC